MNQLQRFLSLCLATLALAVLWAPGASAQQIGSPPPEFDGERWFNSPPLYLSELRGRPVLVKVLRTWCPVCPSMVRPLNSKQEKENASGLVVIGVTNESPVLVEAWIERHGAEFPIVCTSNTEFEAALWVRSFPTIGIVDPMGTLTFAGDHQTFGSPLKEALKKSEAQPYYPKKLAKVVGLFREGKRTQAFVELGKLLDKGKLKAEDQARAEALALWFEKEAAGGLERARAHVEGGNVEMALREAEPLAESKRPFAVSPEAAALVEAIRADENFKRALKASKAFNEARILEGSSESIDRAIKAYVKIGKDFEGLPIATLALERIVKAEEMKKRMKEEEEKRKKGDGSNPYGLPGGGAPDPC